MNRSPLTGGKGSIFYRAHSYHTKVPPEGLVPLLEHYSAPGATVLDPFCGSGMTGIAARLAGRRAILSDLSPAAVHIARGYSTPGDPTEIHEAGQWLLTSLAHLERELYGTSCRACASDAMIEYTVWSDLLTCPAGGCVVSFWDASGEGTAGMRGLNCPTCHQAFRKQDAGYVGRIPVSVSVSCTHCRTREQRTLYKKELAAANLDHRPQITDWYPTTPLDEWREMWRGQHRRLGIETAADFFTSRNLRALAAIWSKASGTTCGESLRFASTAIINRASIRYQWNAKRPTNVLSGTLYVASLNYEFNVFSLLRRKLKAVAQLAQALQDAPGSASVSRTSATHLDHVESNSIDYVFTDPPFGSNIYYSDASFLWEAWLGETTDLSAEAVINRSLPKQHGGKGIDDYEKLMGQAFEEITRVLRRGAWASVMFHNSDDAVWSGLQRSLEHAGLQVEAAVAFDKQQPSFKGVKQLLNAERVSSFDLVLHTRPKESTRKVAAPPPQECEDAVLAAISAHLEVAPPRERSTPYLHSLCMRVLLERQWPLKGYSYQHVEQLLSRHFILDAGQWRAPSVEGAGAVT